MALRHLLLGQPRLRFDLEKLRDPDVACTFQATIGGKFAPLTGLSDEDMDMDTMITTYNTAVTDAASEILGKERRRMVWPCLKVFWFNEDNPTGHSERKKKKRQTEEEVERLYQRVDRNGLCQLN